MPRKGRLIILLVGLVVASGTMTQGQSPALNLEKSSDPDRPTALDSDEKLSAQKLDAEGSNAEGLSELITGIVRRSIPDEYENKKEWGMTKPVWDGLHISLDDGQIKTKRRWKEVNHGSWKTYRAWPIHPDQELQVRVMNLREIRPGLAGADLECHIHVGTSGRWSEWRRGVQLFSFGTDADAQVRLTIALELGSRLDVSHFPPDLVLLPKATSADVQLIHFKLIRVSDISGPVARELGDALEGFLRHELRDQQPKIVEKINRQIDKHQDQLRLSAKLWPLQAVMSREATDEK